LDWGPTRDSTRWNTEPGDEEELHERIRTLEPDHCRRLHGRPRHAEGGRCRRARTSTPSSGRRSLPNADLITHDSPSSVDFAGSSAAGNEPAYYAFDSSFLYFRYRLSGNPAKQNGFDQFSWTALMQVPAGDRFKFQYQLSLNGNMDTIEIWKNESRDGQGHRLLPLFNDDSETKLYSTPFNAGGMTLARSLSDATATTFSIRVSVSQLIAAGDLEPRGSGAVVLLPSDVDERQQLQQVAPELPVPALHDPHISKSVAPTVAPTNTVTPVTYTLNVHNAMGLAVGMTVSDVAFPAYLSNVAVGVSERRPGATYMLTSTNPLSSRSRPSPPTRRDRDHHRRRDARLRQSGLHEHRDRRRRERDGAHRDRAPRRPERERHRAL